MSTIARLLRGLLVIVAGIAISTAASTTAASAATFTYDAPALARVDAHASGLAEAELSSPVGDPLVEFAKGGAIAINDQLGSCHEHVRHSAEVIVAKLHDHGRRVAHRHTRRRIRSAAVCRVGAPGTCQGV